MLNAWQSGTTGAFESPRDNTAGDVIYRMNTCLSVLPVRLRLAIGLKLLWVSPIQSKLTIDCIRLRSLENLPIAAVFFFFMCFRCRWWAVQVILWWPVATCLHSLRFWEANNERVGAQINFPSRSYCCYIAGCVINNVYRVIIPKWQVGTYYVCF